MIMTLKKYLLLLFFLASMCAPALGDGLDVDESEPLTPRRQSAPHTGEIAAPTPGEQHSQRLADIFRRDKFVKVLGEEIVSGWKVDWDTLENSSISFDNAAKRSNIYRIITKIDKIDSFSEEFEILYARSMRAYRAAEKVHLDRLKNIVGNFFESKFPNSTITTSDKMNGDQLGEVVKVTEPNGESTRYFVKTHSAGKKAEKSSAAKKVNPKELFVYKVLEYLGVGPKTYFTGRSDTDIYIITKDVAAEGTFDIFETLRKSDAGKRREIWGRLEDIDTTQETINYLEIEQSLQGDDASQNYLKQVTTIDLLSRLMNLSDLLNNSDNYGFLISDKQDSKVSLKIIDFRVVEMDDYNATNDNFRGFEAGNGRFNYGSTHKTLRYPLRDRALVDRTRSALYAMTEGSLKDMKLAIENAFNDTASFFRENESLFEESIKFYLDDLVAYRNAIDGNFELFKTKLENWNEDDK